MSFFYNPTRIHEKKFFNNRNKVYYVKLQESKDSSDREVKGECFTNKNHGNKNYVVFGVLTIE